jgi:glucosylceramidase
MSTPLQFSSQPEQPWKSVSSSALSSTSISEVTITAAGGPAETWDGFGGCFNEIGWQSLRRLPGKERAKIMEALFGESGLKLDSGRIPMGASDYASEWHSYTERRDDFALDGFSIKRDQTELLPFIHEAQALRNDLRFFGSPWSPPTWMKFPSVYNFGNFKMEEKYLDCYARYFSRFITTYREHGVNVSEVHPQNEPVADQKFPSCVWTGEQLCEFIGGHLGPVLARENPGTEVWLGTMNTDDYQGMFLPTLADKTARRYLRGVGLQWAGKGVAHRLRQQHPDLPVWQTENECGNGTNSWAYAHKVFDLIVHYLGAGCSGYVYWNLVLPPGGQSSWGWLQNTLITVDPDTGRWTLNPEYYVMRHFSTHIRPGARRIPLAGTWAGASVAYFNSDGSLAVVSHNPTKEARVLSIKLAEHEVEMELPALSFNTLVWESTAGKPIHGNLSSASAKGHQASQPAMA